MVLNLRILPINEMTNILFIAYVIDEYTTYSFFLTNEFLFKKVLCTPVQENPLQFE